MNLPAARLFLALWPDEAVQQRLLLRARQVADLRQGQKVPYQNFHLTLAFLGSVPIARVDRLLRVMRKVAMQPLTLCIDRAGYWAEPRVLWLGPAEVPPELPLLVDGIWDGLATMGFEREDRPFKPHITICRKMAAPQQLKDVDPVLWTPPDFALVESRQRSDGSAYTVLRRFPVVTSSAD